ncbi:MAG TPA: patatin-like phospholipase family protein [Acidimicrobiales bacterium]|nr:patatin-like phospholipase family protein [Acidimicrobiales bacterium]
MTRALVLSGGGPVGIAWETGIVTGLADAGVDLADADLIVGTSAGAAVGAQMAIGLDLTEQLSRFHRPASGSAGPAAGAGLAKLIELMTEPGDPEERRRRIGRYALEADTAPEAAFVASFEHLRAKRWPARFRCTAADAESGEFAVWEGQPGVDLDRAVASSCAVPGIFPPITINGRRYIDGGMRSLTNADLAAGHDRVLVVTLTGGARSAGAGPWAEHLRRTSAAEREAIAAAGGVVEVVGPDAEASSVMGLNLMASDRLLEVAEVARSQAKREADRLGDFWAA